MKTLFEYVKKYRVVFLCFVFGALTLLVYAEQNTITKEHVDTEQDIVTQQDIIHSLDPLKSSPQEQKLSFTESIDLLIPYIKDVSHVYETDASQFSYTGTQLIRKEALLDEDSLLPLQEKFLL